MSYSLPGMQVYPLAVDSPSGMSDIPIVGQNPITGTQHIGSSVSGSYAVNADVPAFILLFGIAFLGCVGLYHFLGSGKLSLG